MQPLIYDVAVSVDGFIDGPGGDISAFPAEGPIVDDYLARLEGYAAALMGRATYEFGYRFGLVPGANPYPAMKTVIVSTSLGLPSGAEVEVVAADAASRVAALKREAAGPVYLCGGGALAGWAAASGLLDVLRLKRPPIVLGAGTPLLRGAAPRLSHRHTRSYPDGSVFQEFAVENVSR